MISQDDNSSDVEDRSRFVAGNDLRRCEGTNSAAPSPRNTHANHFSLPASSDDALYAPPIWHRNRVLAHATTGARIQKYQSILRLEYVLEIYQDGKQAGWPKMHIDFWGTYEGKNDHMEWSLTNDSTIERNRNTQCS